MKFEYYYNSLDIDGFIFKEVFSYCRKLKFGEKKEIYLEFGQFLERIEMKRFELTWINFDIFVTEEKEIINFIEKEFAKYLIDKDKDKLSFYLSTILDDYYVLVTPYRYYYIKHFMWIFIPTNLEKIDLNTNQIYDKLPGIVKKIPGIKSIIKYAGSNPFIGFFKEK